MMRLGYLLILMLVVHCLSGQQSLKDSMTYLVYEDSTATEEELIGGHYELGKSYIVRELDSSLVHLERGLSLIEQGATHPAIDKFDFLYFKSIYHSQRKELSKADSILLKMESLLDEASFPQKVKLYISLRRGTHASMNADSINTYKHFSEALQFAEEFRDSSLLAMAHNNMAYYYRNFGDRLDLVSHHLIQSVQSIDQNHRNIPILNLNIGTLNYKLRNDSVALDYFDKVLETENKVESTTNSVKAAIIISRIYQERMEFEKAMEVLEVAMPIAIRSNKDDVLSDCFIESARIHYALDNLILAQQDFEKAYQLKKKLRYFRAAGYSAFMLADILFEKDKAAGLEYYQEAKSITKYKSFNTRSEWIRLNDMSQVAVKYEDYGYAAELELVRLSNIQDTYEKEIRIGAVQSQEEYEAKLDAIKNEQVIKDLRRQRRKLSIQYTLLSLGILSLLGVLMFLINLRARQKVNRILSQRSKELEKTNVELSQNNALLRKFALVTSQDIKQILTPVDSISEKLVNEVKPIGNPAIQNYSQYIHDAVRRMGKLLDGIIHYTEITGTEELPSSQEIQLSSLINEVTQIVIKDSTHTNQSVNFVGEDFSINVSKEYISTVFENLIDNGLRYNRSEYPTVTISAKQESDLLTIIFVDNGIGIPPEYRKHIFKMFNRLHNYSEYNGSGLGLSLVQKIIQRMQGSIHIDSSINLGTTVEVVLPSSVLSNQ